MAKLIFPLHGIRTRAEWQKAFADLAAKHSWKCPLDRWHYGVFSIFNFINPKDRFAKVTWFRKRYSEAQYEYQTIIDNFEKRPSVVAHSFGTYILGYSLLRYNNIKFDKVILCGSILPTNFPWDELIESGQVRAVRNDIGVEDYWSKVCGYVIPGTGSSGNQGFSKKHPRLIETEHNLMHSEFFESEWMETNWLPFLDEKFETPPNPRTGRIKIPSGDHPLAILIIWSIILATLISLCALGVSRGKHFFSPQQVDLEFMFDDDPPAELPASTKYLGYFNPRGSVVNFSIKRGTAIISLPWNATKIDSIELADDGFYYSDGPYSLDGKPINIKVRSTIINIEKPNWPNLFLLQDLPTKQEVERIRRVFNPSEVTLHYGNASSRSVALFAYDLGDYYGNGRQPLGVWPCRRQFKPYKNFKEPSQGAFFFLARDLESESDYPLGLFSLFEHKTNYLQILDQEGKLTATLSTTKP
jgi:hypothetical protein